MAATHPDCDRCSTLSENPLLSGLRGAHSGRSSLPHLVLEALTALHFGCSVAAVTLQHASRACALG
jgi:hypothetical protein